MKRMKPSSPFGRLDFQGDSITLDTEGKVLVLPTGDVDVLPLYNEYTLNPNRLTTAESPFGGLKGSQAADFCPGTIYSHTTGVQITDLSGTNGTHTMSAGKLNELSLLTVDTENHTITQEFNITNYNQFGTIIDDCTSTTDWTPYLSTGDFSISNGLLFTGTTSPAGHSICSKEVSIDLSNIKFLTFTITSSIAGNLYVRLIDVSGNFVTWMTSSNFSISANTETRFTLPIKAISGSVGSLPTGRTSTVDFSQIVTMRIGVSTEAMSSSITILLNEIKGANETSAYIELMVPDNLSATSANLFTHDGTQYNLCRSDSLDSAYSNVTQTSANATLADGTKFDDVYTTGLGRSVYPKGEAGGTKNGSIGSITYSDYAGTLKRIGYRFDLPPYDGGRTLFDTVKCTIVINYAPDSDGIYSASYNFSYSENDSYGILNMACPWLALYDSVSDVIDFYLSTSRFEHLKLKRDEAGTIHDITLYPGNGQIYHGQIRYADLSADSDSDGIPNCLDNFIEGSVSKFLACYSEPVQTPYPIFGFWKWSVSTDDYQPTWNKLAYVSCNHFEPTSTGTFTDPVSMDIFISVRDQAHLNGKKSILAVGCGDQDIIDSILENYTQDFATNLLSVIQNNNCDGVTIDFEYPRATNTITGTSNTPLFQNLMSAIYTTLKTSNPDYYVSVCSPNAPSALFQNSELYQYLDHVFIMGYDYHNANASTAGPCAPYDDSMRYDINDAISAYLKCAPQDKFIFGLPLYGFDYPTVSDTPGAATTGGANYVPISTAFTNSEGKTVAWDQYSHTPYYIYQDGEQWRQVWYDNIASLQLKYNYIMSRGLYGVGWWALGYEINNPEILSSIYNNSKNKLNIINGITSGNYCTGETVSIRAYPPRGYVFDHWIGDTTRITDPTVYYTNIPYMPANEVNLECICTSFSSTWYNASWGHRIEIATDPYFVSAAQTGIPFFVSIQNDSLKTSPTGHVANANGYDIIFVAVDGTTVLDHIIKSYNGTTGTIEAYVNLPSLSSTNNTVFYMYYGNASITESQEDAVNTFDSDYLLKWYAEAVFPQETTYTGDLSGIPAAFTVSAKIKPSGSGWRYIFTNNGVGNDGYRLCINDTNYLTFTLATVSDYVFSGISQLENDYEYYISIVVAGGNATAYVTREGCETETQIKGAGTMVGTPAHYTVGENYNGDDFTGTIYEVVVSDTVRSASWLRTLAKNRVNGKSCIAYDEETNT